MRATRRLVAIALLGAVPLFSGTVALAKTPVTPVPPGYGHYCSMLYSGKTPWQFRLGQTITSDPCNDILKSFPNGIIARAGLWSVEGENNLLIRCDGVPPVPAKVRGSANINDLVTKAKGAKNCVVTLAPVVLPVFGRPYGATQGLGSPDIDIDKIFMGGFNFDSHFDAWSVTEFGQPADPGNPSNLAIQFDRLGRQEGRTGTNAECLAKGMSSPCTLGRTGSPAECSAFGQLPGCSVAESFEPAYDWNMPKGKPLLAVAAGSVIQAWSRDTSGLKGCGLIDPKQKEIYIEHQIGDGTYAERFVTAYYHLASFANEAGAPTNTPPASGVTLKKGQTIGYVGSTGCSGSPHVDFRVVRLTNLTGGRSFTFQVQPTLASQEGYGSNGLAGHIDPFGWAAPKGVDPWAWKSIGATTGFAFPAGITDFGAFSINLWLPGNAPPTYWSSPGRSDYCRFVGNDPDIFLSCAFPTQTGFGNYDLSSKPGFSGLDPGYANMQSFMADVDGEGRADFCRFVGNAPGIFLSCALATATGFGNYDRNSQPGIDLGYDNPRFMADVDGDGRADFCRVVGNGPARFVSCLLATATGLGPQEFAGQPGMDLGYDNMPRFMADVDGDGRADYCRFVGNAPAIFLSCALSQPTGFGNYDWNSKPGLSGLDPGYDNRPRFMADVNGDGRADYCRFVGNDPDIFFSCALSTITYDTNVPTTATPGFGNYDWNSQPGFAGFDPGYDNMPRFMADVNGDGRADYCRFVGNDPGIFLSCALSTIVFGSPMKPGFGNYDLNSNGGVAGFDPGYLDRPSFGANVQGK